MPPASTPHPAFSEAWAQAWGEELNSNPAYRKASAAWEGDLVLEMAGSEDTPARAVYLDLHQGVCRAARQATTEDLARARYRFEGSQQAWRRLLGGALSPAVAILTGQLKLTRGSLTDFLPYASAVTSLLGAGVAIAATFPDD